MTGMTKATENQFKKGIGELERAVKHLKDAILAGKKTKEKGQEAAATRQTFQRQMISRAEVGLKQACAGTTTLSYAVDTMLEGK